MQIGWRSRRLDLALDLDLDLTSAALLHRRERDEQHEGDRAEAGREHAEVEHVVRVARAAGAHQEDAKQRDARADDRIRPFRRALVTCVRRLAADTLIPD